MLLVFLSISHLPHNSLVNIDFLKILLQAHLFLYDLHQNEKNYLIFKHIMLLGYIVEAIADCCKNNDNKAIVHNILNVLY